MNEQEATQITNEIWELARKSHWMPIGPLTFVSELGYFRKPDVMQFPQTYAGLQEALAWLHQQAAITWIKHDPTDEAASHA